MRRYKYTIRLVLLLLVIAGVYIGLFHQKNKCNDKGGDYVMSFPIGYTCVGETKEEAQ